MANETVGIFTTLDQIKKMGTQNENRFAEKSAIDELRELVEGLQASAEGSALRYGGSCAFADLPEAAEANANKFYNITDAFVTTDAFLEGAGKPCPAGTNVAVVETENGYAYDAGSLGVDVSNLVEKEDGKGLSSNDFTDADKEKLDGFRAATDEEFDAMLAEIYPTDTTD